MSDLDRLRLSAYYLNSRRLSAIGGGVLPLEAQTSLARNSEARVRAMYDVVNYAEGLLRSGDVPNLATVFPNIGTEGERLLAFVWGVFTFRGASQAIQREYEGKAHKNATFCGTIPLGDEEYEFQGELFNDHYFSVSSPGMLKGKRRMLVAGQFQFDGNRVEVFPYIVGEVAKETSFLPISWSSSIRVYPTNLDAFQSIRGNRPTAAEVRRVLEIPEEDVKRAFAEIIGEPFIPKDWGGERSDLYTSRLLVDGKPTSAAFIFKGPSVRGAMHPRNMGKRGDQLVRAFEEPADLIVVQHCNEIASSVVRLAEALAYDLRRPRRYCIIDGADTALILKAHGKLPA